MEEAFNPYLEWLGIWDGRRPANHYELLGIACRESDPGAIARAADGLTSRIRSIRPGERLAQWQQILDEVAKAKACLLNPAAKAAYDAVLRGQQVSMPVPQPGYPSPTTAPPVWPHPSVVPDAQTSPVEPMVGVFPSLQTVQRPRAPAKPAKPNSPHVAGWLFTLLAAVSLAVFAAVFYRQQPQSGTSEHAVAQGEADSRDRGSAHPPRHPAPHKGAKSSPPPKAPADQQPNHKTTQPPQEKKTPAVPPAKPEKPATPDKPLTPDQQVGLEVPAPQDKPAAEKPKDDTKTGPDDKTKPTDEQKPEGPVDPAKQEALKRALAEARAAMSDRDLETARKHVKAARPLAQTPAEEAHVGRAETLLGDLEEFWKGMSQILASLQTGEELSLGDTMMIVVSADAREVTFRSEGSNRSCSLKQLPHEIVVSLAKARFVKNASSKALLGAYLAVDPEGDPALARQLWQEATREGQDMTEMMAELGASAGNVPRGDRPPPPADPATLQQAQQAMKAAFKGELEGATTPVKKAELAKRLFDRGRTTTDNAELRFVMLQEAAKIAAASGKPALACSAVDQIARFHAIDDLAMKASLLDEAAKTARGTQGCREVAEQSLRLVEQAVAARRVDDAKRLIRAAASAAQKSQNVSLVRRVHAVAQQLQAIPSTPAGDDPIQ